MVAARIQTMAHINQHYDAAFVAWQNTSSLTAEALQIGQGSQCHVGVSINMGLHEKNQ